ncbi:hypothetical protein [Leclercia sp. Marseille-Q4284]|uniref:hypothetical protein n=1 Tax=Leclercia sp. Marseille-Q4284 TaxID=2866582 RepID=UPI001CE45920|nr:hypothetical protein [Leclercia sp. Marseille-Q4284]
MTHYKIVLLLMFSFMIQGCSDTSHGIYRSDFVIKHPLSNQPLSGVPYKIISPDGTIIKGKTDKNGLTAEATSKKPGEFILTLIPAGEL